MTAPDELNTNGMSRRTALKRGLLASTIAGVGIPMFSGTVAAGLGQGVAAHYQLNNLKGKGPDKDEVHDTSTNDNDGTAVGGVTPVDGKEENAFEFDGNGDYVDIDDDSSFSPTTNNEITLAAWVKADSTQPEAASGIVTKDDRGSNREWNLHLSSGSSPTPWAVRCRIPPLNDPDRVDGTTDLRDNTWHHVVGRWDGSELSVWVDAMKDNSVQTSGSMADTHANVRIGNFPDNSFHMDGAIDDVYVFNRALDEEEICQLFMRGLADKLVAYYPLDEFADTDIVPDESDNDNDGTAFGDPMVVGGQVDDAFEFDGMDDYIQVDDDTSLDITSAMTVSAWVNTDNVGSSHHAIVDKISANNNWLLSGYYLVLLQSEEFQFQVRDGSALYRATTSIDVATDTWYHVLGWFDGSDVRIYVDGSHEDTTSGAGLAENDAPVDIGANIDSGVGNTHYWDGTIDEIRIYDRALPESEIKGLYHCQSL